MPVPWRLHQKGITTVSILWGMYQLAWRDDRKITIEDFPELATGTVALTWMWGPEALSIAAVSTTPLVIVEAAVVAGAIASVAIGGEEGLDTYVDYITDPVAIFTEPKKTETLMQAAEIVTAVFNPLGWVAGQVGTYLGETLYEYRDEIFRNRWVTGPVLPW